MRIKAIVSGAAIALAATIGSASAADRFSTITGVEAQAITNQEMEVVRGSRGFKLSVMPPPMDPGTPVVFERIIGSLAGGNGPARAVDQSADILLFSGI